ncbi:hypothetical protein [Verrucomicrobium sp. BvORR034]|uniref:hypothetical protein n=1 Tax=Verrucomicrobium sp. BvORR034 TaxID=1396418 RepID=UPI000679A184|nr:hypothetical protein [Verrucomicrobium sp. BvORR034]
MELIDTFKPDSLGRILTDETFTNKVFSDFTLSPPGASRFLMRGVKFEGCRVTPGTCVIEAGSVLDEVVFTNFECGDAMHIASEVAMRNVTIQGKESPRMLWIRPSGKAELLRSTHACKGGCSLDISGYNGELSITGIDVKRVRIDPQLHVKIDLGKMNTVDWKSLGIGGLSYWRLMARKVSADGATEGIFSMPSKESRNYEKSMAELDLLRKAGVEM